MVKSITTGILSGYNKDLQETKEAVFKTFDILRKTIDTMNIVFKNISINEENVKKKLTKGIFATDIAFSFVKKGLPFREAYVKASQEIEKIEINDELIKRSIDERISYGSPNTLDENEIMKPIQNIEQMIDEKNNIFKNKIESLLS